MWDFGMDAVALDVDPDGYDGPPSRAWPFRHRSGWLRISTARFEMPFITWQRTLIACVTDRGEVLSPSVASLLFAMPASHPRAPEGHPPDELDEVTDDLYADFLGRTDQDNLLHMEEANERGEVKIARFEARSAALLAKVGAATRHLRSERRRPEVTVHEQAVIDDKLTRLSTAADELAAEGRKRAATIRGETAELEADILAALREHGEVEHRIKVRWRAVPARFGRPVRFELHRPESEVWSLVVRDRSTQVVERWRW